MVLEFLSWLLVSQSGASVRDQGVQRDPPRCAAMMPVGAVHPTPLGRATHVDPVGSAITGAAIVQLVHQRLQQQRPDVVMLLPIGGELAGTAGQHVTGQMRDVNPGQEQETTLVDEVLEVFPPGVILPADPLVPRRHPPGGGGVLQEAEGFRCRFGGLNQVTTERRRVCDGSGRGTSRGVPWRIGAAAGSRPAPAGAVGGGRVAARSSGTSVSFRRHPQGVALGQARQQIAAFAGLQPVVGAPPVQQFTHRGRPFVTAEVGVVGEVLPASVREDSGSQGLLTLERTAPRLGARLVQQGPRLRSPLDGPWLTAPGAVADLFAGQPCEQRVDHAAGRFALP